MAKSAIIFRFTFEIKNVKQRNKNNNKTTLKNTSASMLAIKKVTKRKLSPSFFLL